MVLWSVSCSHVPSMIESSTWHMVRSNDVVVLAALSVNVNSATNSRNNALNTPVLTHQNKKLIKPIINSLFAIIQNCSFLNNTGIAYQDYIQNNKVPRDLLLNSKYSIGTYNVKGYFTSRPTIHQYDSRGSTMHNASLLKNWQTLNRGAKNFKRTENWEFKIPS